MRRQVAISVMTISMTALGCGLFERAAAPPPAPVPAHERLPVADVETTRARLGRIHPHVSAPGSILARRVSRIGAEVRGRISEVLVDEGDRVREGDPLFQIDRKTFEVALRQAEAGLLLARSERRQIEADLQRLDQLQKLAIVSIDERDRMRTNVAVAKAREAQAAETVALARHNLDQTLVTAPFSGSIAARLVDEGTTALVQPQTIVVVLHETAQLEAEANIPESEMADLQVGDPALVQVEGQSTAIETALSSVGDTIDAATRTYRVRMPVANADHRLRAGVFAKIDIFPREQHEVMLLPRESIRSEAGQTRVLVVRDGRATALPVRLGTATTTQVEVLSGVDPDDEVIVGASAREIAPGMRVRGVTKQARAAQ